jgi:hypothetical protein
VGTVTFDYNQMTRGGRTMSSLKQQERERAVAKVNIYYLGLYQSLKGDFNFSYLRAFAKVTSVRYFVCNHLPIRDRSWQSD